ncbi:MAG: sigma-70 family RNA polymerase sigma factor [Oscillospiraceae bacterium]|nr:sigma-70 family RNA polymerase sigma factor [Oscillospiraceae bacterium]
MEQQIEQIIAKYYRAVYCYCTSRLLDAEGAKDCTQEVFLALYRKQDQLTSLDEIRPWLYRAADLSIREYRRKNSRYISIPDDELERICETVLPDDSEDTVREVLSEEEYSLVWRHYVEGRTMRELAAESGISEDAVKQRVSRIRRKLSASLRAERGQRRNG